MARVCGSKPMMCKPLPARNYATCPERGTLMTPRSWLGTWGLTLLIVSVVVAAVLFVAYFGQG